jgi:ATP/maltotriose-dependent transcriptional regulator MalT
VLASKEEPRSDRQTAGRAFAAFTIGAVEVARGRLHEARPKLEQAIRVATAVHYPGPVIDARHAIAELELAAGNLDVGLAQYRTILADAHGGFLQHHLPQILRDAATAFALHDDELGLAMCAERAAQLVADIGGEDSMAAMGHVLGESLVRQGDDAGACDRFARATDLLRGLSLPYWGARTQVRYAAALALSAEREAAIEQLSEAHRAARRLGARTLAGEASRQLRRLGANLHRSVETLGESEHARGLTRREVQVLRALATGGTNREIAARMFLSPRTIDMHVRNILSKLDCHTRTEAVVTARELRLLPRTRSDVDHEASLG